MTKTDFIDSLYIQFDNHIKTASIDKLNFGEVMTPISLVEKMLNQLPENVWSNPKLTWLDPAAGCGVFSLIIIKRLMNGLSEFEENEERRYKYIIENMIYVCEIQNKNIDLYNFFFNKENNYNLNYLCGDFLKDFNCNKKFDIIIGNPPYNNINTGKGGRELWMPFVRKSFDLLSDNGFLCLIHPAKWRKPNHDIFELFKKNNLIFLEIHNEKQGLKIFKAQTRFDFYVLQKSIYSGITKIIDEKGIVNLINIKEWKWLPNFNFDLIHYLISKPGEECCEIIYSSYMYGNFTKHMSKIEINNFNLPCIYGMQKNGSCSYFYSCQDRGHFKQPKIILSLGRHVYSILDYEGKYGMMQNSCGIPIKSKQEGEEIKKIIDGVNFKEIINATKWANYQTHYQMFQSFKKNFWEFI